MEGWWEVLCGRGVGLRVKAESCEKSSERIQTKCWSRGGGLQGGDVLSFVFTDLSSLLRCSIQSAGNAEPSSASVLQHRVLCCHSVPWLRVGLLEFSGSGQQAALCSSSPGALWFKCT